MFAIKSSASTSESSSTSNTDYTSSSAESGNRLLKDLVDLQPPKKASARDNLKEAPAKPDESPSPTQESSDEEYSGIYPKPKPGYTRRLIRMVLIPVSVWAAENFDEDAWLKKVYGPDVIIVDMHSVPKGWILVDGQCPCLERLLMIDPSPPPPTTKIKKRWDPFDHDDPNSEINLKRARYGLPPIDKWNLGVEYTYRSIPKCLLC